MWAFHLSAFCDVVDICWKSSVFNFLFGRNICPQKINFLYPLDDMTAVHSWIQAEHSQRHDLTTSDIGEDVSDIFIVKMPWKMDKTDAKVDNANTDSCVSVAFFLRLNTIRNCKVLRFNSIRPNRPLPIHSSPLALLSPLPSPSLKS